MIRTLISLDPEDKLWLDRKAEEENVSMTQLVRTAIRHYREECEASTPTLDRLLEETAGIRQGEDGLSVQLRLREEWGGEEEER
jgi:hypothetical protein